MENVPKSEFRLVVVFLDLHVAASATVVHPLRGVNESGGDFLQKNTTAIDTVNLK